jgi:hypothetical protein
VLGAGEEGIVILGAGPVWSMIAKTAAAKASSHRLQKARLI